MKTQQNNKQKKGKTNRSIPSEDFYGDSFLDDEKEYSVKPKGTRKHFQSDDE